MPIVLRPPSDTDRAELPERLALLGRSRHRVAVGAGAFALVGVVLADALLACSLDTWLHLAALPRAMMLVLTLAAAGVIARVWVVRPLRLPTDPLAVALELETRFPRLNDSLGSAVSFLEDAEGGDNRGVSRRLRRAAVKRAERMAERHDFRQIVPNRRFWFSFWACAVAAAVAMPVALANTGRAATALVRFGDPFGIHPWPSKTRIDLLKPTIFPARLPKGDPFELKFAVTGVVPDRASVTFRINGGSEFDPTEGAGYPLAVGADPEFPKAAVVSTRQDAVQWSGTFQVRVTAGDGDTGWQSVTIVPPPRLVPLDGRASPQVHVAPPEYTGLKPTDLPDGATVIEVPTGTAVTFRAATDVRLSAAVLSYQGDRSPVERASPIAPLGLLNPLAAFGSQSLAEDIGADIPLALVGDGRVMLGTFTPSMSGMYLLKMTDETGLPGNRTIEIRLTPDPVPVVTLIRPALSRDPPILVPEAAVTVQLSAEDRIYALRRTFLEYRVGKDGSVRTIPLDDSQAAWAALPGAVGFGVAVRPQPSRFEARFSLPVAAFLRDDGSPVRDGDTVYLRAAADDWDDVTVLKEPGRSIEFEIRIASKEAVEAFLQRELAAIRPDLIRLRDQQRDAAKRTGDAKPKDDGTLTPADREKLLAAEQTQRQIRGKVADPRDGTRARADVLREMVRANGLPKSNTTDRVEAVADELNRLTDRDISAVEPILGEARQQSVQPAKPGQEKAVAGLLARAARHQKAIDDGLSNLIDILSQWGDAGGIRGDARVLRDNVVREAGTADKLPEKVPPGKTPDNLTPGQRGDLDKAGAKVDQLSEQANGLLGRATKLAGEKEKQAADARAAAEAKEKDAAGLKAKAAPLVPGSAERRNLEGKADAANAEAAELKAAADRAAAEAAAIRKALDAAGGQALPDELRRAADALRNNRQGEAAGLERSAAGRLDKIADELTEKPQEQVPELAKAQKNRANQLDEIAAAQDDLRKKTDAANRIADPKKREDELKRLSTEQQKLIDQTRDLVQRLTRERAEDAAKDARDALDKMNAARDDLERGMAPTDEQKDAVAKLDDARDKLDNAAAKAPRELADEKRRKLADKAKALHEKQKAAIAEAVRIQEKVLKDKKWDRPLLASYGDLEDRERALAAEARQLADQDFAELPVFARVLKDAADGMEKAGDKAKARRQDALDADAAFDADLEKANDRTVRRPMDLAARRLTQLLDALKPDDPKKEAKKPDGPKKGSGMPMMPPGGNPNGNGDAVSPLAQLKTLRALQADLNERTAEFAKLHPDKDKFTDDEKDELKELEDAQREITSLFEEVAKLFQQQQPPTPDKP